jgi:TP901 family phage tail tape measure protein
MPSLGDLFVTVGAKIDGFERAMGTVSQRLNQFDKDANKAVGGLDKMFTRLEEMGKALTVGLTLPLGAAAAAALTFFGDFESSMNRVSALGDITGASLERLKNKAIELGAKTKFSAQQAADGMAELAAKGYSAEQILATIPAVLDLAAVEAMDLAAATNITATALNQFGLSAEQAGHVADVLAKASSETSTNVKNLGDALQYVGPIAHAAGMSLESTVAALALLSQSGVEAEKAGTGLRGMLASLLNPSDDAAKTLTRLGVAVKDAAGNMRPLPDILQDMKAKGANLTDTFNVFGKEAATVASILMDQGKPALDAFADGLVKSDGAASKMAETINRGWKGALEQLKGSLETAAISIGDILAPVAIKLAAVIQSLADWVAKAAQEFKKLPDSVQLVLGGIVALAAAVGPLLLTIGLLGQAFAAASGGLIAFGAALGMSETAGIMGSLTKLPGLARAAGAALLDAFVTMPSKIPSFAALFAPIVDALKALPGLVAAAASTTLSFFTNLGSSLTTLANTMKTFVLVQFTALTGAISNIAFAVSNGLVGALTMGEKLLLALGQAALMAAAAFAGWKLGQWAYENIGFMRDLGDAIGSVILKIPYLEEAINKLTGASKKLAAANNDLDFATQKLEEALKRKGVVIDKAGKSTEQYREELQQAAKAMTGFEKPVDTAAKSTENLVAQFGKAQAATSKLSEEAKKSAEQMAAFAKANKDAADAARKSSDDWIILTETFRKAVEHQRALEESIQRLKAQLRETPDYIAKMNAELDKMATSLDAARVAADKLRGGVPELNEMMKQTLDGMKDSALASDQFGAAISKLGMTSVADYRKIAEEAKKTYDAVMGGPSTGMEQQTALYKLLKAQADLLKATGQQIPADMKKMMDDLEKVVGDGAKKIEDPFRQMRENISRIVYDFSADLVKSLWEGGGSFVDKGITALKALGEAVMMHFVGPAMDAISKFIANSIADLLGGKGLGGVLDAFKKIGEASKEAFSGAAGAGAGAGGAGGGTGNTPAPPTDTGGAGSGGSGGGGGMGGGTSLVSIFDMLGSLVTAVSSIIGNFQMYAMNKSLDLIEHEVRYSQIHLLHILEKINEHLPGLDVINQRLNEWAMMGFPDAIFQKLDTSNMWLEQIKGAINDCWGLIDEIKAAVLQIADGGMRFAPAGGNTEIPPASSEPATTPGEDPQSFGMGSVVVQIDGREVARAVVNYADDSGRRPA